MQIVTFINLNLNSDTYRSIIEIHNVDKINTSNPMEKILDDYEIYLTTPDGNMANTRTAKKQAL